MSLFERLLAAVFWAAFSMEIALLAMTLLWMTVTSGSTVSFPAWPLLVVGALAFAGAWVGTA